MTMTTKTTTTPWDTVWARLLTLYSKSLDLGLDSLVFLIIAVTRSFEFLLLSLQLAFLLILASTLYSNWTLTRTSHTALTWVRSQKKNLKTTMKKDPTDAATS